MTPDTPPHDTWQVGTWYNTGMRPSPKLAGRLLVLLLVTFATACAPFGSPAPASQPTAAPSSPTRTPITVAPATPTLLPTITPTPLPTATLRPTDTPTPTATPRPTDTP